MENVVSSPNFTFLDFPISPPMDSDHFYFLDQEESLYYRNEPENLSQSPPFVHPGIREHFDEIHDDTYDLLQSEASSIVKDRLILAIEYLKDYVEDSRVLIQIWMPMKKGDQNVLTTIDQPYSLNLNCRNLASYRNISESFHLATSGEDSKEYSAGLPGRVFSGKFPEWSPDVRFFRNDECPRKSFAEMYEISGCLALPVFDHRNVCLAVVEIVTTCQKISYHLEIEIVCKALEAVDLRSWHDFFPLSLQACNEINQIAVPEISETLQFICQTYKLPLAQTWTLHEGGFDTEMQLDYCISTVNSACYVADDDLFGFHEACSEQSLFLDQGIVGKAFASNMQRFATDITSLSKTNYPLSHHARIFDLGAAVAIPLRNVYTGLVQFVLELFLPRDCKDIEQQKHMCDLLSAVIQQACQSFLVVMDTEIDDRVDETSVIASIWTPYSCLKEEPEDEFKIITQWDDDHNDFEKIQKHSVIRNCSRAAEKRQNKIDKTITLQVLRQYFAGSLKEAAKSIGVCPTTLKRICRQHGINRWPSRKIKKVNHSLRKLQLVVNSIHGAEGLIKIDSFYKAYPEWNFAEVPDKKDSFLALEKSDKSNRIHLLNPKSQSSLSSQNSDLSIGFSTEAKKLNRNGCSDRKILEERPKTSDRNDQTRQTEPELPKNNTSGLRVKATLGEEHIRFSFLNHWSLRDLQDEIAKRFKIEDFRRTDLNLKYIDIDNEPVLLTCDADLEECVDLLSLSCSKIIKISLHQQHKPMLMPN